MKRRVTTVILFIICCMCLAACADEAGRLRFQFAVGCSVKFDYTCTDESKNFNSEADKENSKIIIEKLNKISYVEVKEHIDFGPSYDCLTIFIGNDRIDLHDTMYTIDDGGYFMYKGKLCETNDGFDFLLDYINIKN